MGTQANVTLTALNGDLSIAERTITLHRENRVVPVGRASKSVTKGILGAINNAWFDSPVMSRNHAELGLNTEDMMVTIKDIGSMHGTYLNDIELSKDEPMAVSDGDIIVFGAEVRRGPEIFPACSFRVNYKVVPYRAANTFTFPESSDVDDDEGEDNYDEFSEDDLEMEERERQYSSEDGLSMESPPQKSSQAMEAIDLTGDDCPGSSAINRLDLTGDADIEEQPIEMMPGHFAEINGNADPLSIEVSADILPIVLDSENEDADFDSDLDDQSEDNESETSNEDMMRAIFGEDTDDSVESENEGSIADSDADSDGEVVEDEHLNSMSSQPVVFSNLTRYAVSTDKNPIVHLSDVRTRLELPESDAEEDGSDLGLSEAGEEGMNALYGGSGFGTNRTIPAWERTDETMNEGVDGSNFGVSPQVPSEAALEPISAQSASNNPNEATPHHCQSTFQNLLGQPTTSVRQPSPSDAAMVKSALPPRRVSVCDLGETHDYTSQSLGEKSGKPAFFAAREVNKARFNGAEHEGAHRASIKATFALPTAAVDGFEKWADNALAISQDPAPTDVTMFDSIATKQAQPLFTRPYETIPSIPTRDYCSFLDKPDQTPILDRAPSPLPDMTSSFSYNTSKDSMAADPVLIHSPRSAIKIPDIIESSSSFSRTNSLKRKSDHISDATDKELRDWANSNVSDLSPAVTAAGETLVQGEFRDCVPSAPNPVENPPTKRLKKLLENVGYVALGGATLFAALVATAPDLM